MVMWDPWAGQGDCRTLSGESDPFDVYLDMHTVRDWDSYQDILNRSKYKRVRCKLPRFGPTVKRNGPNLDFLMSFSKKEN